MLKIDTKEFAAYIQKLMVQQKAEHLAYEITTRVNKHTYVYAGFAFSIVAAEGFVIAMSEDTLRDNPYSFSNRRAIKRVIRKAKKMTAN